MSTERRGKSKKSPKKSAKASPKSSLPEFEFSDDLLKGKGRTEGEGARAAERSSSGASDKSDAEKKISLPAFGFAEDLLAELKSRRAAPAGTEGAGGAGPGQVPRGEDRVFAFTDSLETGTEEEEQAPVRLETWLTFGLAGEVFALPVDPVHEVVRPTSITRVPHAPYPIRGVTNLRGRVVPVIDLRLRLELPPGELTRTSRIVVVGSRGRRLGLLVDAVHQVVHLDVDRVQAPPDDVMTLQSDYILGVYYLGDELILLLDVDRVLIIKEPVPATAADAGTWGAGAA